MKVFKYEGGRDEEVLEIFEKTLIASPYGIDFNKDYWTQWLEEVTRHPELYLIVLIENEGTIAGVLVGQIYFGHPLIKFSKIAMELFWYIEPEHRGSRTSVDMVDMYENWAEEVGATHVCMSVLSNEYEAKLDRLYRSKGYTPLEKQYIRKIPTNED